LRVQNLNPLNANANTHKALKFLATLAQTKSKNILGVSERGYNLLQNGILNFLFRLSQL